ncbi:MAG: hypothetical protein ABGX47_19540 [Martelella sp.]|uniref:hypothetical protein n=1 Tax=Martelella sp. TaxID=1969699 RepID=UPI0032421D62
MRVASTSCFSIASMISPLPVNALYSIAFVNRSAKFAAACGKLVLRCGDTGLKRDHVAAQNQPAQHLERI